MLGRKIFSEISPVHMKPFVAAACRATCHLTCRQGVICRRDVLQRCRQGKFPFRKGSLSCLRQLEIFDLLLRVILTSNMDLSYPNLSPLPLHYHTDPPNVRKIKVHKLANHIADLLQPYTPTRQLRSS